MSKTVFEPSIRSRPVYGEIEVRAGQAHLMVADAQGAEAILDMAKGPGGDLMSKAHVLYIPKNTGETYVDKLKALNPAQFYIGSSYVAVTSRLQRVLMDAHMGLQVYLAGTEGLIGQAMRDAIAAGIPHSAIQSEHRGSTARRMQCVHCKGITEDVMTDPFQCEHCGLYLYVRDHYSRRVAAFQGVRVDAEDPGNVPAPVALFK